MAKMIRYILPRGQKSDVIDVMLGVACHLYITKSRRGEGGKPIAYVC